MSFSLGGPARRHRVTRDGGIRLDHQLCVCVLGGTPIRIVAVDLSASKLLTRIKTLME